MFPESYSTINKTPMYDGSTDLYKNGIEYLGNTIVSRNREIECEVGHK